MFEDMAFYEQLGKILYSKHTLFYESKTQYDFPGFQ